jgi:kynurenine formamidase
MKTYIDLSHTIEHGMITYQGLPGPVISDFLSRKKSHERYDPGTEFHIALIEMVSNTGTYMDTPFHRYEGGRDLADLQLDQLVDLEAVTIKANDPAYKAIGKSVFTGYDLTGKAVLVNTGFDKYWGTDKYFHSPPFLTREAVEYIASQCPILVGIDTYNIDDTDDLSRPAHTILLGKDILIIEHMCNLRELPEKDYLFTAVPQKIRGVGSFPVRAFATV